MNEHLSVTPLDRFYEVHDQKVQVFRVEEERLEVVFVEDLPQPARDTFRRWLHGQTVMSIGDRGIAAYEWDFQPWLSVYKRGVEAPIYD